MRCYQRLDTLHFYDGSLSEMLQERMRLTTLTLSLKMLQEVQGSGDFLADSTGYRKANRACDTVVSILRWMLIPDAKAPGYHSSLTVSSFQRLGFCIHLSELILFPIDVVCLC